MSLVDPGSRANLPVEITVVTLLNVKKVENLPVSKTITYRL